MRYERGDSGANPFARGYPKRVTLVGLNLSRATLVGLNLSRATLVCLNVGPNRYTSHCIMNDHVR